MCLTQVPLQRITPPQSRPSLMSRHQKTSAMRTGNKKCGGGVPLRCDPASATPHQPGFDGPSPLQVQVFEMDSVTPSLHFQRSRSTDCGSSTRSRTLKSTDLFCGHRSRPHNCRCLHQRSALIRNTCGSSPTHTYMHVWVNPSQAVQPGVSSSSAQASASSVGYPLYELSLPVTRPQAGHVVRPLATPQRCSPVDLRTKRRSGEPCRNCSCTKSHCLKLYCRCFASGATCSGCKCSSCLNNSEHENIRHKAMEICLDLNPDAFKPNVNNKGCKCKLSGCLKAYCICFEAEVECTSSCKCVNCVNRKRSEVSRNETPGEAASVRDKGVCGVVESMLAQAVRAEREGLSLAQAERRILEEFGESLSRLVASMFE